jgi:PiT family inorganic phosphate transporter
MTMVILALASVAGLFLAYANGANDNSKGVATLFGSGVTGYRGAILWGTAATALGSLAALVFARGLLAAFSGKGLVPESVLSMPSFPLAVGLAAGTTVMLATRFGFPISTTHTLVGALVGTGLLASSAGIDLAKLAATFVVPLLAGPFLAVAGTLLVYPALRFARERLGVRRESCVCMGTRIIALVPAGASPEQALAVFSGSLPVPSVATGVKPVCLDRYQGDVLGVEAGPTLDRAHYLSAGVASFARGLNDTPKLAAILVAGAAISPSAGIMGAAVFMALGGLLNARRIAETMGHRVTAMNAGQGFTANLVTGGLVIAASRMGLPVSMTHVSCGALFGIGAVTGQARWKMIAQILVAWVTTLPVAAALGAAFFLILQQIHSIP